MKVIIGILVALLVVFVVMPPAQETDVVCGGFHWFADGMVHVTGMASEYVNGLNNGSIAPRFGSKSVLTLDQMDVSCHEKVRRSFEFGYSDSWARIVRNGK